MLPVVIANRFANKPHKLPIAVLIIPRGILHLLPSLSLWWQTLNFHGIPVRNFEFWNFKCPNYHAMLHQKSPPLVVEELKERLHPEGYIRKELFASFSAKQISSVVPPLKILFRPIETPFLRTPVVDDLATHPDFLKSGFAIGS
jgi:hypothetical protein